MEQAIQHLWSKLKMKTYRSNISKGSAWEQDFIKHLRDKGFWVTALNPTRTGSQPCDVIAVNQNEALLFDCKTVSGTRFYLRRIEPNQEMAFKYFAQVTKADDRCFIAVRDDCGGIYILNALELLRLRDSGVKSVKLNEYNSKK